MGIIGTLGSLVGGDQNKKIAKCCLTELKDDGTIQTPVVSFQYFPETISDSRGVDYIVKDVVGGSHPIYQWTNGSERTISFEALFTADLSRDPVNPLQQAAGIIGGLAKNPAATLTSLATNALTQNKASPWDQDIRSALAWLRAKTYPLYQGNNPLKPPPKLLLYVQNSGITSFVTKTWPIDVVTVLMTQCNVVYESFFRNGMPRIVTVSLEFKEIVQVGNAWKFVSRSDFDTYWQKSKLLPKGPSPTSSGGSSGTSNGINLRLGF